MTTVEDYTPFTEHCTIQNPFCRDTFFLVHRRISLCPTKILCLVKVVSVNEFEELKKPSQNAPIF